MQKASSDILAPLVKLSPREFYQITAKGVQLYIDVRYKDLKPIGCGSYGIVCSAVDIVTNQKVAMKISPTVFYHLGDAVRTLREIKYLHFFNGCEEVVNILDFYCYPYLPYVSSTQRIPTQVYVVIPYFDYDLEAIIDARNYLSFDQIKVISYQILLALCHIHSAGFMHRDIKPSNVLINRSMDICDFGLARADLTNLTNYVVTRDYRAPELLCGNRSYSNKIDMWSFGMVFAEMCNGAPLFLNVPVNKLIDLILEVVGMPSQEDLQMIETASTRAVVAQKRVVVKPISCAFSRDIPEEAIDLLRGLLVFNPTKRMSALETIRHPFYQDLFEKMKPRLCGGKYDGRWEQQFILEGTAPELRKDYIIEQQFFPLTKCTYTKKPSINR